MEKLGILAEKVLAGSIDVACCDVDNDFNDAELEALLKAGLISPGDFCESRAAELIMTRVLTFEDRPFAGFSHDYRIWLIASGDAKEKDCDAETYIGFMTAEYWLKLLGENPDADAEAPWEKLRDDASADSWFRFLARRPEHADKADWKRICEFGSIYRCIDMLMEQPELYEFCHCKDQLLHGADRYWRFELVKHQPVFADVFDLSEFDRYERAEILTHRPELVRKFDWEGDRPVKLVVVNRTVGDNPAGRRDWHPAFTIALRSILQKLNLSDMAYGLAGRIADSRESSAGIWSLSFAGELVQTLWREFHDSELPLAVWPEELSGNGDGNDNTNDNTND